MIQALYYQQVRPISRQAALNSNVLRSNNPVGASAEAGCLSGPAVRILISQT